MAGESSVRVALSPPSGLMTDQVVQQQSPPQHHALNSPDQRSLRSGVGRYMDNMSELGSPQALHLSPMGPPTASAFQPQDGLALFPGMAPYFVQPGAFSPYPFQAVPLPLSRPKTWDQKSHVARSPLLEDFRLTLREKAWELDVSRFVEPLSTVHWAKPSSSSSAQLSSFPATSMGPDLSRQSWNPAPRKPSSLCLTRSSRMRTKS